MFTGMLGMTLFGIFLPPVFYLVLEKLGGRKPAEGQQSAATNTTEGTQY